MEKPFLRVIIAFAVLGLIVSIYEVLHHYALAPGSFCDLSATFNCDVVNRGPYSEILGIPVSAMGVFGYAFMLIAAILRLKRTEDDGILYFLFLSSVGGMLFSLYLTGIEAFVLQTFCILCLSSQTAIFVIFGLSSGLAFKNHRHRKGSKAAAHGVPGV